MQLACFVYIKRCWMSDKRILEKVVKYFSAINYKYSLILFPEGTDLTETTKQKSNMYAKKNNLHTYDHILHPRTTGFTFLVQEMLENSNLTAIYDMTLLYPDLVPQNEVALVKGEFPEEVRIHLARYKK